MSYSRYLPKALIYAAMALVLINLAGEARVSAQEQESGDKLENRISTEGKSGVSSYIVNLYNDHRLVFALAITVTMGILGLVVGQITEMILNLLGIKRPKRRT